MSTQKPQRSSPKPPADPRAITALVVLLVCGPALAQSGTDDETDAQAAFVWRIARHQATDGQPPPAQEIDPESSTASGPDDPSNADPSAAAPTKADPWILGAWTPTIEIDPSTTIDAGFQFRALDARLGAGRADRWARSIFANDASQLTPLTIGQEVVGWELADGLTLSGVGSRRIITDRDRGFVLSAEAGIRLAPNAGFQLGYEVLQASAGTAGADLGSESLFARFQLRF